MNQEPDFVLEDTESPTDAIYDCFIIKRARYPHKISGEVYDGFIVRIEPSLPVNIEVGSFFISELEYLAVFPRHEGFSLSERPTSWMMVNTYGNKSEHVDQIDELSSEVFRPAGSKIIPSSPFMLYPSRRKADWL